jgi:hypothetical protein
MNWFLENMKWIFSGIGVILLVAIINWIRGKRKAKASQSINTQQQVTHSHSTAYQAGRDIVIGDQKTSTNKSILMRVHRAFFENDPIEHYFINVVNASQKADVEITHVWYEGSKRVDIIVSHRPLPRLLHPSQSWETWVATDMIPNDSDVFQKFRVRFSTGEVIESEFNKDVPPRGFVPGGS